LVVKNIIIFNDPNRISLQVEREKKLQQGQECTEEASGARIASIELTSEVVPGETTSTNR
jgi:hypothetical protein